jgi:hypothetical protein
MRSILVTAMILTTSGAVSEETAENALAAANEAIAHGDITRKDGDSRALLANGCQVSFVSGQANSEFEGSHIRRQITVDARTLLFDQAETRDNYVATFASIPSSADEVSIDYTFSGVSGQFDSSICAFLLQSFKLPDPGGDIGEGNCKSSRPRSKPSLGISYPEPGQFDRMETAISALEKFSKVCESP